MPGSVLPFSDEKDKLRTLSPSFDELFDSELSVLGSDVEHAGTTAEGISSLSDPETPVASVVFRFGQRVETGKYSKCSLL
jgi:hypothetical protein